MTTVDEYRPGRVVAGVVFFVVGLAYLLESLRVWIVRPVDLWPLFLIAFGTSVLLGRVRRIKVEEDRSAQLAVAEERVRIARELHDIVAHGVSLMTIQIAAARRVARTQPEAAEEALQAAEDTGRQSLAELQGMLSMLRGADASIGAARPTATGDGWGAAVPAGRRGAATNGATATQTRVGPGGREPLPTLADLDALFDGFRQAGTELDVIVFGDNPGLSPGTELAVYRVIQESLTNAVRYAGGAPVSVELTYWPGEVLVYVQDEGPGAAAPPRGAGTGHGLLGMQERVVAMGGAFEAGPRQPGPGWQVRASLPAFGVPS